MVEVSKVPKAPPGLGVAGKALWKQLTDVYSFDTREMITLGIVCRQADMIAELENQLRADGLIVVGVAGQERLSPIPAELRAGRLALSRLLGELHLPAENTGRVLSPRSARASHAASSRWTRVRREAAERAEGA